MSELTNWSNGIEKHPFPGITTKRIDLGNLTMVQYSFESNCTFPLHRHPEEQVVMIESGSCTMKTDKGTYELKAGDVAFNPSMEPHGITSGDQGVVFVNLLTPRRTKDLIEYLENIN